MTKGIQPSESEFVKLARGRPNYQQDFENFSLTGDTNSSMPAPSSAISRDSCFKLSSISKYNLNSEIDFSEFEFEKRVFIGRGSQAQVYRVHWINKDRDVAFKTIHDGSLSSTPINVEEYKL